MVEYVVCHFEWDRRGVAFPLSPLPKDFHALCRSSELAVAEEAAEHFKHPFKHPKLPEVIFDAKLLKEAERLGVLHGRALRTLESALTELCWKESSGVGQPEEDSEVKQEGESLATEGAASPSDDDKQGHLSFRKEWYNRRGKKIKNARHALKQLKRNKKIRGQTNIEYD
ncbi:hypothetical protein Cgig2_027460 [Carnegiea gigantea]|uniref:Uncharacterized protein n=1 Tax=Carnegiea gigantea TaxID=171969 RepID=A0A9Q1KN88_9CARY|nr:hypothetical protein Cgig2_027460 [Carnegiea gigantea]